MLLGLSFTTMLSNNFSFSFYSNTNRKPSALLSESVVSLLRVIAVFSD